MEIIKGRWSVSPKRLKELQELSKAEIMAIIKGFKLGTGKESRKRLEKQAYDTFRAATKPKKVYKTRSRKSGKGDNS